VLLLLFFVSPVLYGLDQVPKPWQPLLVLNPLTGLLDAYQHVVYLGAWPRWGLLAWSAGAAAIALVVGWAVFEWRRWSFAEQV
jgi:ABC-type polysaccharide/polyol phosphate export permease